MARNIIIAILVIALLLVGGVALYENQQLQQAKLQSEQATKDKQDAEMKAKDAETLQMQEEQKIKDEQMKANTITVALNEENKSGESGTATLTEANGKVTVKVDLTGFIKDIAQPAHIHVGDCPGVGKVKYPLTDVVNGSSTTTLDTTIADLKKSLPLALNVHKSKTQISVYTACGSLGGTNSSSTPSVTTTATTTPSVTPAASASPAPTK